MERSPSLVLIVGQNSTEESFVVGKSYTDVCLVV